MDERIHWVAEKVRIRVVSQMYVSRGRILGRVFVPVEGGRRPRVVNVAVISTAYGPT